MLRIATRNLLRSKLRTGLTIVGVGAAVCMLVLLVSIGRELAFDIREALLGDSVDIVVQSATATSPLGSRIATTTLPLIATIPGVANVAPLLAKTVKPKRGLLLVVMGVSAYEPVAKRLGVSLIKGRNFRAGTDEVLLGQRAARKLELGVGDALVLGKRSFEIVGVYSLGLDFLDGGAFLDMERAQEFLALKGKVNIAYIEMTEGARIDEVIGLIEERFPGLAALPAGDMVRNDAAVQMVGTFATAVSLIGLAVCGVTVLNTLLMSVAERTGEFGTLMALGWPRQMIMGIILIEALLMCTLGALVGFAAAYPALEILNALPSIAPGILPSSPSITLLPEALLVAVILSFASGLYPAIHTTRLLPALALRYT